MAKKVLGISFGRKMSNCDVMVKHILMECEKAGCEVAFLRADDMNITNCNGCIACTIGTMTGRGRGYCVRHDDFDIMDECLMQSDAVILACPTYETSVTGRFKTICDRIGPSHDITFRQAAYDEGKAAGKPESALPDVRTFKKRTAALISVGGAMTENWIALTLPMMYEFTFPLGIDVVDTVEYYGAMACENVAANFPMMDRMTRMAQNVLDSMNAETEEERIKYRGDEEGICPLCHGRLLQVSHDLKTVDCVVCGSHGNIRIDEEGKIRVSYTPEELDRSRLRWGGKLEHSTEIKTKAQPSGTIKNLKELKQPYADFNRPAFPVDETAYHNVKLNK
ncbi:MAG: NAD(P)H-dependent oxidoreductase [Lachnospiraceae bacterium]|nr:NAD(P)H-dependent oxidoreductase [Lachnospiraceae bacterium]